MVERRDADGAAGGAEDPGERALIDALLGGDESAFEALVARHQASLLRVARLFVSSGAVAEEVVQETWLAVIQGLPAFERRSSIRTWIFRILSNRAKTRGKREGRMVPLAAFADDDDPEADRLRFAPNGHWREPPRRFVTETPESLALRAEIRATVEGALRDLPPAQRAVVTLRDVEGWSGTEVCEALELSEANQRVLLHRGRARLRSALEQDLDPRKRGG